MFGEGKRTGIIKKGEFKIGGGLSFDAPSGQTVVITKEEDHPVFGKRYMILGYDVWFERNCFEKIDLEDKNQ
jgi:hypothetical protein